MTRSASCSSKVERALSAAIASCSASTPAMPELSISVSSSLNKCTSPSKYPATGKMVTGPPQEQQTAWPLMRSALEMSWTLRQRSQLLGWKIMAQPRQ
jgi:hypothetical protein